jgi:DNA polymerase III sliding clamp (beta) subunit (PCNA family)
MKFKKESLDFLELYLLCENNTDEMSSKFEVITDIKNKVVTFVQFSDYIKLITEVSLEDDSLTEDFKLIYPTSKFVRLLKSCNKGEIISLTSEGIDLPLGHYDFGTEEWSNEDDLKVFKEMLKQRPVDRINVQDLHKLVLLKPYLGSRGLDAIHLNKGWFVSSNRFDSTGVLKTNNDQNTNFYLSLEVINICNVFKIEELTFNIYNSDPNFYTFDFGDTKVIIVERDDYDIPDVFNKDIQKEYHHDKKLFLNRTELKQSLDRIKILASENLDSRIFLTIKSDHVLIESKDKDIEYAFEKVKSEISSEEIAGVEVVLSAVHLSNMVSSLTHENLTLSIPIKEDPVAIDLIDDNEDRFFIHCVYDPCD